MIPFTNEIVTILSVISSETTDDILFRAAPTKELEASRITILSYTILRFKIASSVTYKISFTTKKTPERTNKLSKV